MAIERAKKVIKVMDEREVTLHTLVASGDHDSLMVANDLAIEMNCGLPNSSPTHHLTIDYNTLNNREIRVGRVGFMIAGAGLDSTPYLDNNGIHLSTAGKSFYYRGYAGSLVTLLALPYQRSSK